MKDGFTGYRSIARLFWLLASAAILIWGLIPGYVVGWDLHVYANAIESLRLGHDPYADGMAIQRVYHAQLLSHPESLVGLPTPFTYVYSPATIPLLRLIAALPLGFSNTVYWIVYGFGVLAAVLFGVWTAEGKLEERVFTMLAPAAVFFPGLLQNDVLFSGNVAYILYGFVFGAAYLGWRRGQWAWFYAAVFAASCCKAPMLTLLAIPVFSARRQWLPALLTGAAGLLSFAVQPLLWPTLFHHYLEAVELQFSFNHDFSSSPAGLLAETFYRLIPYGVTSVVSYCIYACLITCTLFYFSRRYFAGELTLKRWVPVLVVGVILLNPRIMEYDVAPIALPMALLLWRVASRNSSLRMTIVKAGLVFAVANVVAAQAVFAHSWRPVECLLLAGLFMGGAWNLWLDVHANLTDVESPALAEMLVSPE